MLVSAEILVTLTAVQSFLAVCLYMSSHIIRSGEKILPALFAVKLLLLHNVLF